MAIKKHNRQYDVVVFGATGYTGRLTVEYIAEHLPTNLKWAIAGRSESKLQAIVSECKAAHPDRSAPAIEIADTSDANQIKKLVSKAFVLIATVGPYCVYGEVAFKACAEVGTHYLDVTGEVPWVRKMIQKYETTAKSSGAIMIPQIGLESAPADLVTWVLADRLRKDLNAQVGEVAISIHSIGGAPSGGTLSTVFTLFDQFSLKDIKDTFAPYSLSPIPHTSKPDRPSPSISQLLFGSHSVSDLGTLTTSVAGLTDAAQVERTWGLLSTIPSKKSQFYGPNFRWAESYRVRNWLSGVAIHWALLIGSLFVTLVPPFRALAKKLVTQPGEGPDKEAHRREIVEYKGVAYPDTKDQSKKALVYAKYHGGPYYLTALYLSEAAITLLEDDVELDGGVFTPVCLGETFVNRVHDAGFRMDSKIVQN